MQVPDRVIIAPDVIAQIDLAIEKTSRRRHDWFVHRLEVEIRAQRLPNNPPSNPGFLEQTFFVWWHQMANCGYFDRDAFEIVGQQEVPERVDFVIQPAFQFQTEAKAYGIGVPRLAVELDGRVAHERTRPQVITRDRRDRRLQEAGWEVKHFSYEEFIKDPMPVVQEVAWRAGTLFGPSSPFRWQLATAATIGALKTGDHA
jgi:hypothetical protein